MADETKRRRESNISARDALAARRRGHVGAPQLTPRATLGAEAEQLREELVRELRRGADRIAAERDAANDRVLRSVDDRIDALEARMAPSVHRHLAKLEERVAELEAKLAQSTGA